MDFSYLFIFFRINNFVHKMNYLCSFLQKIIHLQSIKLQPYSKILIKY